MDGLAPLAIGFVSLVLIPSLGVVNLFRRRVTPVLSVALLLWGVGGLWALASGNHPGYSHERFQRVWLLGMTLGVGLLLVARLRERRRTWRWVRLALTAVTIVVFLKALLAYVQTYA